MHKKNFYLSSRTRYFRTLICSSNDNHVSDKSQTSTDVNDLRILAKGKENSLKSKSLKGLFWLRLVINMIGSLFSADRVLARPTNTNNQLVALEASTVTRKIKTVSLNALAANVDNKHEASTQHAGFGNSSNKQSVCSYEQTMFSSGHTHSRLCDTTNSSSTVFVNTQMAETGKPFTPRAEDYYKTLASLYMNLMFCGLPTLHN